MGKVANFFFNFPKYENGMLRTSFYSQITFSVVGRGPKWSNMPKFHKGDPVRSSGKQNRCQAIYVARNFLVAFLLKHFSPGEI